MSYAIGIDLGGTRIKAAAFDPNSGDLLAKDTSPTRDGEWEQNVPAFATDAKKLVDQFKVTLGAEPTFLGVSAPGLADEKNASIRHMPGRLDGLEGFDWSEYFRRPAPVLNDAHAALFGEIWRGGAAGVRDVIMLTLGTGVGGAIVSGGTLLAGHLGRAGHLGHITVDFEGGPDICGTPGSLEDQIGNATVGARSGGRFASTRELLDAVSTGDGSAAAVWEKSVRALAAGIASLVNVLDPEVVLIGGGIAEADGSLFVPLGRYLEQFEWRPAGHRVEIRKAELGEWAGCYGAARRAIL